MGHGVFPKGDISKKVPLNPTDFALREYPMPHSIPAPLERPPLPTSRLVARKGLERVAGK